MKLTRREVRKTTYVLELNDRELDELYVQLSDINRKYGLKSPSAALDLIEWLEAPDEEVHLPPFDTPGWLEGCRTEEKD